MLRMIADAHRRFPEADVIIKPKIDSAAFYESLGFVREFAPFVKLGAERQQLRFRHCEALLPR